MTEKRKGEKRGGERNGKMEIKKKKIAIVEVSKKVAIVEVSQ